MSAYDPLGGTPQQQQQQQQQHHHQQTTPNRFSSPTASSSPNSLNPTISPLAPRSPLPGQERGYRPQPLPPPPSTSAWGVTSPPTTPSQGTGNAAHGGWGSPTPPPPPPHANGATQGGMQPRSAQTWGSPSRRGPEGEDDDDDETLGRTRVGGAAPPPQNKGPPAEGFVRVRILGLEKNRKDIYIKFNAESNLPAYRHSTYRSISRSYTEFAKLAEALSVTCPQSILPALPLAQTSAATDDEDDRLVKAAFQKWIGRLTSDHAVARDEELRSFIESDFGYTPRSRKRGTSSFGFSRSSKLPGEKDDELTMAKSAMSGLEHACIDASKVVEKVAKARRGYAGALADVGDHLNTFSTTETYGPLATGIKKLARTTKLTADLAAIQATTELVTLGDSLAYQAMNARSAKETLTGREGIVEEHRTAIKATISRRRNIEKLKTSSNIKGERVDEALEELDEAEKHEALLTKRLAAISANLEPSLRTHSRQTHEDLVSTLLEHARTNLLYEKQRLKELELVRPELHGIKKPPAGVYYHQSVGASSPNLRSLPEPASAPQSPTLGRRAPAPADRNFGDGTKSMYVGGSARDHQQQHDPLGAQGANPAVTSMGGGGRGAANGTAKRSVRSMASSVIVDGDRRQRVDARAAASMLANGF